MPERHERRQESLKCLDCKLEFTGWAIWVVHTIERRAVAWAR
jgi:hypothetical protein